MTSDESHGPQCLALMYHYVHDREPSAPLDGAVGPTAQAFRAQLDRLGAAMEPIDWPRFYAWTQGRGAIPQRCFLLTFDDGLKDHAETVLPILQERGLRGVFFVPGAVLTAQRLLSAHAVHLLLSHVDEATFEHDLHELLGAHDGYGTDWAGGVSAAAAQAMYPYETPHRARLKYLLTVALPIELRTWALQALFERHVGSSRRWARRWYLDWDDLVAMQSSGHTIGAHGFAHESYTRLAPATQRADLRQAAAVLREGLGPDRRPFSYPYGSHDENARAACRGAGFVHAFTTQRNWISRRGDAFRLPRVDTIDVDAVLKEESKCLDV